MIAFPSILAVKVTREISNRNNFNRQIFQKKFDEIQKQYSKSIRAMFPK